MDEILPSSNWIGRIKKTAASATAPVIFIGAVAVALPQIIKKRTLRLKDLVYYLDLCGTKSLGVVLLISALMGMVLAIQGALQLKKVGTDIFIVDLVGFAVLKEFGPLMVAIIATGRAGSAFAAEIGTMKVNEEIFALYYSMGGRLVTLGSDAVAASNPRRISAPVESRWWKILLRQ